MLRMSEVNAVDHQSMQHLLSQGAVDWDGFGNQLAHEANVLLGGAQSVLLIDESGFAKKGERSAGVARQWNGRLGKVDNCQVGVFAALCRGDMASLVDARLYLPQAWADDAQRCEQAAIPEDARDYRSKTALALEMVATARRRGLRFGYVGVDGGYGKEPAFLYGLDAFGLPIRRRCPLSSIGLSSGPRPAGARVVGPRASPSAPPGAVGRGAGRPLGRLAAGRRLAAPVPARGEQGQLVAEYLQTRVWVWDHSQAQARGWQLFVRREVGASEISHYCLSNAPEHTPWTELARVQAQRFFIEHSFREAKGECGLADYQVRRWDAWHYHMALVMLATLFLTKQKIRDRKQWPMLSCNDLVTALAHLLPRRQLTAEDLAEIITQRHRRREQAKESHARRAAALHGI